MTVEKLAVMVNREFSEVRQEFTDIRQEMGGMATKEDLQRFATKEDLKTTEVRILQTVDKIAPAFDKAEKDHAADKLLHDRHERRPEKIEANSRTEIGITSSSRAILRAFSFP